MPLVFVHGVRTRPGKVWEKQREARRSYFVRYVLKELVDDPDAVHYAEPMWGPYGAQPRWNHASLPTGDEESFNIGDPVGEAALAIVESGLTPVPDAAPDRQLLERAREGRDEGIEDDDRRPLEEVVDAVWAIAMASAPEEELPGLAELGARASAYAAENPEPDWLDEATSDADMINLLLRDLAEDEEAEDESFGFKEIADRIRESTKRATGSVGWLAGSGFVAAARAPLHKLGAIFIGDVLVYMKTRGTRENPGKIPNVVAAALDEARAAIRPEDPKLYVVAHSMGGEIVYDLLTHFRTDIEVDVLVTVGSQVALFEELKQFHASRDDVPSATTPRVKRPENVGRWINVFDLNDLVGFGAVAVFSGVEDYKYSTGKGAVSAHGTYLTLPSFHRRLHARLRPPH